MKKQKIITIVLAVLLVLAVSYIIIDKYNEYKQQEQINIFQQGYELAIIQIAQQASTCQQVPLNIQNQSINIIATECLKQ